jgi:uncharacterized protein YxjI
MRSHYTSAFVSILFLLFLAPASAVADTSNKWRIEVSGGANSDGEMVFHVTPQDGEAIVVRVTVEDGTGENNVADTIRDAFEVQLPRDHYKVEVDDGEDVLVKKKGDAANFGLTLASSTVKNTKIEIEKE